MKKYYTCSVLGDILIQLLLSDEVSIPSSQQALACLRVCQMLSNGYRAIYLFRYDTSRQIVYIQAGTEAQNDEIEIEIPDNGLWRFIS